MSDNPKELVRNGSSLPHLIQNTCYADDVVLLNTPADDGEDPFSLE